MAAEIIEAQDLDESELSDLPTDESQAPSDVIASLEGVDTTAPTDPDELPDKYRGKSIKDVVAMHQEAEKLIGKHSGEVGELRQYVDGFIKGKLGEAESQQMAPEEEVDFFEDPQKAVSKAIESHPSVRAAAEQSQNYARQTAMSALKEKHPDLETVLANPNFAEWVKASPVRRELFQRADNQYDFDCADELVGQYKERTAVVSQAAATETQSRQQAVKAASTGSASGASTAGSKRIYRRADIIKLMKTDPDRYEALSGEIYKAYQEDRVR